MINFNSLPKKLNDKFNTDFIWWNLPKQLNDYFTCKNFKWFSLDKQVDEIIESNGC